ncbi:VanZ family protein [Desulforhopalus sp. 52FAK]
MQKESVSFQIFLYCLCGFLVLFFVNLYGVWALADNLLPASVIKLLPVTAVLLFVVTVFLYYSRRRVTTCKVHWPMVWAGGFGCIFALTLPDGQFPVKRVHVIEYMILVCLVRYTMSYHLQGRLLLFFSVLATIMFGLHDELLQGLHPSRTYGLRDMIVNACAALGGGLIWHGGSLFLRPEKNDQKTVERNDLTIASAYLVWLCFSVIAFVFPLMAYRQELIPYWLLLPLSGSVVLWALYSSEIKGPLKYGCTVVNCIVFLFLIYPVVINGSSYIFH